MGTTSIATLTTTNEGELLLGQTGDFDELAIYDVAINRQRGTIDRQQHVVRLEIL